MKNIAKPLIMAAVMAVTASMTGAFAESQASLQAGSSSSTMNTAQSSRETSTSSSTQNNSMSSNQQTSQATTQNTSNGSSEAVGGPLNANRPGIRNYAPGASNRVLPAPSVSSSSVRSGQANRKVSRAVTHSYSWKHPRSKRTFSTAYMQKTIRQAAITR